MADRGRGPAGVGLRNAQHWGALPLGGMLPGLTCIQHRLLRDPQSFYAALSEVGAARELRIHTPGHQVYQWAGELDIGSTTLISIGSSAVSFAIADAPTVLLAVSFAGHRQIKTPLGTGHCLNRGIALMPLGDRCISGQFSGALLPLRLDHIIQTAAAMAGRNPAALAGQRGFGQFAPLSRPDGPEAQLVHGLLRTMNAAAGLDPRLPARLGCDDSLHRLVATMLQPALLVEEPARDLQRWRERDGSQAFDELIDYIRANLDQPLRLSELEARSHYSSRALQYAFRQRLGCTPRQWIREQRLERAMAQLEQGGRGCSIRMIALACGYRHMGLFSSDFKKRFGLTPSAARWRTAAPARGG